jgi:hypothetical protein
MNTTTAGLVLGLAVACASGDQLVILGGQTKEGAFQKFENGKFLFLPTNGKFMKEQSSRVSRIALPNPIKATYETTDGKKEENAVFKGYEKSKFIFIKDGKEVSVPSLTMKQLEPSFESGGGHGDTAGAYPIPNVDLANFVGPLAPEQQAVLDRFTAAKKTFDEFYAVSSSMVQEMDKLKGPKREELLNKLRSRKEAEQPLRKNLLSAYESLVGAFSEQEETQKPTGKPPSKAMGGLKRLSK